MTPTELSTVRKAHGLTQKSLAELLGYTANYISRLERGDEPIMPRFAKIVQAVLQKKKRKNLYNIP